MRDIKFRAWNGKLKQMHSVTELFCESGSSILKELSIFKTLLMQFTGLKDKNGVELYHDDIYIQWGEVCKCDFEQAICEKMNRLIFDGDFEIIGNIYENPELLERSK